MPRDLKGNIKNSVNVNYLINMINILVFKRPPFLITDRVTTVLFEILIQIILQSFWKYLPLLTIQRNTFLYFFIVKNDLIGYVNYFKDVFRVVSRPYHFRFDSPRFFKNFFFLLPLKVDGLSFV